MSLYARIDNGKIEEFFETDGDISTMFPEDFVWIDVTKTKPAPVYGWVFDGNKFTEPAVDYVSQAEQEKNQKLSVAESTISLWQTKLLLGRISDTEKDSLNKWLDYIEAIMSINTSKAPKIEWPDSP
ncbi:tail fiber assembly protein [Pantoea sp. DY-15]|uniref:tail fiber assembly protein n=1 Tax=Pantoea sp. DY-15 TaxID=2871489 RepID=UPI001C954605|nr:tail fiber assembly protein [Pantoea sp. DY-15]MBY4887686.1 tail fiber assembly protein [Pantoea sp. DY-15]